VTGCSGTDAPIVALAQIFGDTFKDCIRHTASAERSKVMRDWIRANFDVPHVFSDIAAFNGPLESCHLDDMDLFIAGFPCTPFSVMNQSRFKPGYNPFTEAAARPFFEIVKLMKHPLRRPKCLILENVPGANMKLPDSDDESSSGTAQTPLDFILNGTVNGEHWGLANQDHYICGWCMLHASAQGLPQTRRRIYFLVFRTDVMDQSMLDAALSMLTATSGQLPLLPRGSLDDFLNPSVSCIRERSAGSAAPTGSKRRPTQSTGSNLATERCLPKWVADHAAFRTSHCLPPASSPDGRPFSSSLDADARRTLGLSLRCLDICDIVKLLHPDRDDVIIDVSQSIARQSWRYHDRCQTCLA
jgi:site-specific DNA-cytosine methylase